MDDPRRMAVQFLVVSILLHGFSLGCVVAGAGVVVTVLVLSGLPGALIAFGVSLLVCGLMFAITQAVHDEAVRLHGPDNGAAECRCALCVEFKDFWDPPE